MMTNSAGAPIHSGSSLKSEWLQVRGIASYLGVSLKAARQMIYAGKLPYRKFNGRLWSRRDWIDQAIQKGD